MYELVSFFLQPYLLLSIWCTIALANLWRKRREHRGRLLFLTVPFMLMMLISLPIVSRASVFLLERHHEPLATRPDHVGAIVVLGSWVARPKGNRLEPRLGHFSTMRCIRAAELYRQGERCTVIVSGRMRSEPDVEPSLAQLMADFLVTLGVDEEDLIVEEKSRDTFENAYESCKLLRDRNIDHVLLVTDATHMFRAVRCFEGQGVKVIPAGCVYSSGDFTDIGVSDFAPSAHAPSGVQRSFHEAIGLLWYWWQGRLFSASMDQSGESL